MSQQQVLDVITSRDTLLAIAVASASLVLIRVLRPSSQTTPLRGPPRESVLFGQSKVLRKADRECAAPAIQEAWANEYGSVFKRPMALGSDVVVLTDPKAIAHFYKGGETIYGVGSSKKRAFSKVLGGGSILIAEGDDHKRQRRALSAGFSNAKMREYTPLFFESAYRAKAAWDRMLEGSEAFQVDVTTWMNAISLDSMGIAGFSHDFGALHGKQSAVGESFANLEKASLGVLDVVVFLLHPVLPVVNKLPSELARLRMQMSKACGELARLLLANAAGAEETVDAKSILGLLIKSQTASTGFPMTEEEVDSQIRTLMLAGYATTSLLMTWGLIELARNIDIQTALRKELRDKSSARDPTWDELMTESPILDAFVQEVLRLHPSFPETMRVAVKDDIIPLNSPIRLPNGRMTDHVFVKAGQSVAVPIAVVNRLRSLWGEDAWEFKPERWLNDGEGIPAAAKEIQGHRHLTTFSNGPRTCLGKNFAIAEFKVVLSVLVRNYVFELPDGPQTVIRKHLAFTARPTVEGQPPCHVPMRISRIE